MCAVSILDRCCVISFGGLPVCTKATHSEGAWLGPRRVCFRMFALMLNGPQTELTWLCASRNLIHIGADLATSASQAHLAC